MKLLIFGGTSEGHQLAKLLAEAGHSVALSVATDYGRDLAESIVGSQTGLTVIAGRLSQEQMVELFTSERFDKIIDATHPYATVVTENIKAAAAAVNIEYFRLLRPAGQVSDGVTYVNTVQAAVEILENSAESILLTIGSKELEPFTQLINYAERCFVRILPMLDSLQKTLDLGFQASHLICMQGPFSKEINTAMLKSSQAGWLVTKDSGDIGGFEDKISAALALGVQVIVISRSTPEAGDSFDQILAGFGLKNAPNPFFPIFIEITNKPVLVIGGGAIAERRIRSLLRFNALVTIISPQVTEYIKELVAQERVRLINREYEHGDVSAVEPLLVIAATDQREVNRMVGLEASQLKVLASIADRQEECSFYFPAIAENDTLIAGLVSKDRNHSAVREAAIRIRQLLDTGGQ
ncbi:MAG: precorrin-6A reductase [Coriobacteriia bacterium]|nr:precorrin-6A reductase [Coriobacteriia bacterium]